MESRKIYIDYLILAIQALNIKHPKNGLENWLVTIQGELCGKHARRLDMSTIMHQFGLAFYTGIVEGSMHEDERYTRIFDLLTVDDVFMRTVFEAMTAKGNASAAGLKFKFPKHTCTDDTLQCLAHEMRSERFPRDVVIDFSATKGQTFESSKFSDAGVKALLDVLREENCMVCLNIYIHNAHGFISPPMLQELDQKLTECRQRYDESRAHKKPVLRTGHKKASHTHQKLEEETEVKAAKPKKASTSHKKHDDEAVEKAAKPKKRGGLFAKLGKKKDTDADKKKGDKPSPRGHQ